MSIHLPISFLIILMKKKKNRGKSTVLTGYSCTRLRSSAHQQLWKKFAAQSKRCRVQIRVASWQRRVGIIPRLVVVVLHVQVLHLAVVDAQRATGIIYVLTFQRLEQKKWNEHEKNVDRRYYTADETTLHYSSSILVFTRILTLSRVKSMRGG